MSHSGVIAVVNSGLDQKLAADWYHDDKWDIKNLSVNNRGSERYKTIDFTNIKQAWLKDIAKKYTRIIAINGSVDKIQQNLSSLKLFSQFIQEKFSHIGSTDITRFLIEEYLFYLKKADLKPTTRQIRLCNLTSFLKECHRRNLLPNSDPQYLIYPEDIPKIPKNIPRFIPETVMAQLNQHLHHLDKHLQRMLLIHQETGMRISELSALKYDCLSQDSDGDYFIKFFISKINKENAIPISHETANLVLEQQKVVITEWGRQHELLFPIPRHVKQMNGKLKKSKGESIGKQWLRRTITNQLNNLAVKYNICAPTGAIWFFDTHSFRHTTATRMINNGTPQHIVQKFLGHETPTMTSRYAHIHDESMKKEFARFQGKMVNVHGDILKPEQLVDDMAKGSNLETVDAKWLKKNILMQALPNGTCALPVISNACPHANACLTCSNFRTDKRHLNTHKEQLKKTEHIVTFAKTQGWKRQEEMNMPIVDNLKKIISVLEEGGNDTQA
jgi:integrase/recombinase XerD